MAKIPEPDEVQRWRDAHPHLTILGLERELAACRAAGGPADVFAAYLDAQRRAMLASAWTPPDRDEAMRALTVAIADVIAAEGWLDGKRPLGESDIGSSVAEVVGVDLGALDGDSLSDGWRESPRGQAWVWCCALWAEWPSWLRDRHG